MEDLEARAIAQSCVDGGVPAAGDVLERCDVLDERRGNRPRAPRAVSANPESFWDSLLL